MLKIKILKEFLTYISFSDTEKPEGGGARKNSVISEDSIKLLKNIANKNQTKTAAASDTCIEFEDVEEKRRKAEKRNESQKCCLLFFLFLLFLVSVAIIGYFIGMYKIY